MSRADPSTTSSTKADFWTNWGAAAEALTGACTNLYWLAGFVDLLAGLEPDVIGLSYCGIGIGGMLSLLSAGGAAYCHWVLNKIHQVSPDSDDASEHTPLITNSARLPWSRIAVLAGDALSHTGEFAGPITFVGTLAAPGLSRWGRVGLQVGAALFGASASVANIRTCVSAMRQELGGRSPCPANS